MKTNHHVTVSLNGHYIIVPVMAIDIDDARHEAIHVLYYMINTDVNMEVIGVKEIA
ncbi:MAG: hypothetical protein WC123_06880 [Bacilli bacterium]